MYSFEPDYILSNRNMYGYDSNFDVESFLASIKSPLYNFKNIKGKNAANLIQESCNIKNKVVLSGRTFTGINQKWVLATIQKESSGLTQNLSQHRISRILGFGIPDASPINKSTLGFENQIKYACLKLFDYTDINYQKNKEVGIGKIFRVDALLPGKVYVKPVNQATLSCYLYTPWIGNREYQGQKVYGNLLLHQIWVKYFGNPQ